MALRTQGQAIRHALTQRGEVRVDNPALSKYEQWTRTYKVPRAPDGSLQKLDPQQAGTFYFIARYSPTVRIGTMATRSKRLNFGLRSILIKEGGADRAGGPR